MIYSQELQCENWNRGENEMINECPFFHGDKVKVAQIIQLRLTIVENVDDGSGLDNNAKGVEQEEISLL